MKGSRAGGGWAFRILFLSQVVTLASCNGTYRGGDNRPTEAERLAEDLRCVLWNSYGDDWFDAKRRRFEALLDKVYGRDDIVPHVVRFILENPDRQNFTCHMVEVLSGIGTPTAHDGLMQVWDQSFAGSEARGFVLARESAFGYWKGDFDRRPAWYADAKQGGVLHGLVEKYETKEEYCPKDADIVCELIFLLYGEHNGRPACSVMVPEDRRSEVMRRQQTALRRIWDRPGSGDDYLASRTEACVHWVQNAAWSGGATAEELRTLVEQMEGSTEFREGDGTFFAHLLGGICTRTRQELIATWQDFSLSREEREAAKRTLVEFDNDHARGERVRQRAEAYELRYRVWWNPIYEERQRKRARDASRRPPGGSVPESLLLRVNAVLDTRIRIASGDAEGAVRQLREALDGAGGPARALIQTELGLHTVLREGNYRGIEQALEGIGGLREYPGAQTRALWLLARDRRSEGVLLDHIRAIREDWERQDQDSGWLLEVLFARTVMRGGTPGEMEEVGRSLESRIFQEGDPREAERIVAFARWLSRMKHGASMELDAVEGLLASSDWIVRSGQVRVEDVLWSLEQAMAQPEMAGEKVSLVEGGEDLLMMWGDRPDVLMRCGALVGRYGAKTEAMAFYRAARARCDAKGDEEGVRAAGVAQGRVRLSAEEDAVACEQEAQIRELAARPHQGKPRRVPPEEVESVGGAEDYARGVDDKELLRESGRVFYGGGEEGGLVEVSPDGVVDYSEAISALNDRWDEGLRAEGALRVTALAVAGQELWIGRTYGVVVYDREKVEWRTLPLGGLYVDQPVLSIESLGPEGKIVRITAGTPEDPRVYDYDRELEAWLP